MYLNCESFWYVQSELFVVQLPLWVTFVHNFISLISVVLSICHPVKFQPLQYTQFEFHSVSVFAINTNHQLGVPFLVVTIYQYCPPPIYWVASQLKAFVFNGSCGIDDIHALVRSFANPSLLASVFIAIHHVADASWGRTHLSHWYITIADCNWDNAVWRETSLALPCADDNLGNNAAINIPMITITINISTNVNPLNFFISFFCLKNSHRQKIAAPYIFSFCKSLLTFLLDFWERWVIKRDNWLTLWMKMQYLRCITIHHTRFFIMLSFHSEWRIIFLNFHTHWINPWHILSYISLHLQIRHFNHRLTKICSYLTHP